MLRYVGTRNATIWVETDRPCQVEVLGHRARTFCVGGHHYALAVVDDLEPGTIVPYDVRIDGDVCWPPPDSELPPPVIRTLDDRVGVETALKVLVGSCRSAAPHEPPWSLEPAPGTEGRGVDALRAHALRMLHEPPTSWPDLLVLVGDQVYADDTSPGTRERIRRQRVDDLPVEIVADFEEYTWLYHEAWQPDLERWLFSVVPSAMIFDDHDMVDDWNISIDWVRDTRRTSWWREHVVGGLMSYWIYQHLGNLSPDDIALEGLLSQLTSVDDATSLLRKWAEASEEFTPIPGGYRFSFARHLGAARLVVVDSRNGRVLEQGDRAMVDGDEWAWVVSQAAEPTRHLLLATSLPVFVPGGLHDLQTWNEALCDGKWGTRVARWSEKLRRGLDLEDWPAFRRSFDAFVDLVRAVGTGTATRDGAEPPDTITVLSGDIHFTYRAVVTFPDDDGVRSRVNQVVSSPIRNALTKPQRFALRFGASRPGRHIAGLLRRSARLPRPEVSWHVVEGPLFGNSMAELAILGDRCELSVENARADEDGNALLDAHLRATL
jgi:hypothetical protein